MTTLPERLVGSIKTLVAAHRDYCSVIEELAALGASVQTDLDKLVTRQEQLADISLVSKEPFQMPRAIVPTPREVEGAA